MSAKERTSTPEERAEESRRVVAALRDARRHLMSSRWPRSFVTRETSLARIRRNNVYRINSQENP